MNGFTVVFVLALVACFIGVISSNGDGSCSSKIEDCLECTLASGVLTCTECGNNKTVAFDGLSCEECDDVIEDCEECIMVDDNTECAQCGNNKTVSEDGRVCEPPSDSAVLTQASLVAILGIPLMIITLG